MSCCPPDASCIQCPIIVSCVPNLVLSVGQLQFCPDNCKFYYNCAGNKVCLNPTYGNGLRMTENCILQVGLAENRPLVFDDSGNIDIDCEKLITCCQLVNQAQLAAAVSTIYNSVTTAIAAINVAVPKKCGGADVTAADTVFTVGSLKKATAGADANLACDDRVVTWGDLRKCVGGVNVPLVFGDIIQVLADCGTAPAPVGSPPPAVGSPPVGSPPVGSPPVGSPPVGGGGCCDLFNSGAKNYSATFVDGVNTGNTGSVWAVDYQCGNNEYIPWDIQLSAGSLPPGLGLNGVDPNSDGAGHYYFQGFSGAVTNPGVTTNYVFTVAIRPFSAANACVTYAEINYQVNVSNSGPAPVGSPVGDGG